MNVKNVRSMFLLAAAGCTLGLSPIVSAQEDGPSVEVSTVQRLHIGPATYNSRAVASVYNAEDAAACASYLGTPHIIDDINFGPIGPWASTTNNIIRTLELPVANSLAAPVSFDLRVTVWDEANFNASPMVSGTPLYQVTLPINNVPNGIYTVTFSPNAPAGITVPDNDCFIEMECFNSGTTTLKPIASATNPSLLWGVNLTTAGPGSSSADWGRDRDNDGILEGGPVGPAPAEHNQSAFAGGACDTQFLNLLINITGEIPATAPTATSLAVIPTPTLARTDAYTAGQVRWFSFQTGTDISDANLRFFDIDTENSTIGDPAIGLYDSTGNLVASNNDGGSNLQAMLSFGVGRRAAAPGGDAEQYDGYDGELLATQTYYLAVAESPATFGGAFAVSSTGASSGNIALNFRNNASTGALDPSVAPDALDLGVLITPGNQIPATLPEAVGIIWARFELCTDINGADASRYLDIDFSPSDSAGDADQEVFIFGSDGNLKAYDDDDGAGFFPQLSFGHAGPRGPYATGGEPFTGVDGSLSAGVYYLATGPIDVRELANAATDGRFHVRPLGGDNLEIAVDVITGVTVCGPTCGSADFDGDGDTGTDLDIEAFFACLGGDCCGTCGTADFDGDGDTGTDLDIEAFFRVLGGGTC